ncbi:MAG: hypothetical protein ACPGKS_07765, partial [Coraliomargarita sp.]
SKYIKVVNNGSPIQEKALFISKITKLHVKKPLKSHKKSFFANPNIVICVPSGATMPQAILTPPHR